MSSMMNGAWRQPGFCVPNGEVYPHQWLWDSCFHSLVWMDIDEGRAVQELSSALAGQADSGFVPHMTYWSDPTAGTDFWGRPDTSSITQPPMFGHALAQLLERGIRPDDHGIDGTALADRVLRGLRHLLLDRRRSSSGLVCVFHPWESGCDDSPRWPGAEMSAQSWQSSGRSQWRQHKTEMVSALVFDGLTPIGSRLFEVGSVGFSALVAWNAVQVGAALGDSHPMTATVVAEGHRLAEVVRSRWTDSIGTWLDEPMVATGVTDGDVERARAVRTSDALLALLVDPRDEGFSQLARASDFAGRFGPCGVHREERSFDPETYWRGPAWPQLSYLFRQAARQAERHELADRLGEALSGGAAASGLAEYWHPDTGAGFGAAPQTWAGLAALA